MNSKSNFEVAVEFVFRWEGGYVDHPNDPGGATNKGITIHTAKAYGVDVDGDGDTDKEDMRNLPLDVAMQIYKVGYWYGAGCDAYNWDYATALFDTAVNCGVGRAKGWDALAKGNVRTLLEYRVNHYINLAKQPKFKVFFKGWMNRVNDLKKYLEIERQKRNESL